MPSLLERLRRWALRKLDGVPADAAQAAAPVALTPPRASYDEGLLERARLQWHVGDWDSLVTLSHDEVSNHPDRAKLALLVAAALQQRDQPEAAARYVELARGWGCGTKLIAQVLIAGVHNSLARASLLVGDEEAAQAHFRLAVAAGTPRTAAKGAY